MGFLSGSKENVRLTRWKEELEAEPRPHGFAELARAYLVRGEHDAARDVLERAETLFPDNDEVRRVRVLLAGAEGHERLTEAKEAVRKSPSAQSYLELADAYRSVGRSDLCVETLRDLIDRFGDHGTALVQLGEIRCQRFRDNLSSTDGVAAEELLRRAVEAEPAALKPRFLLAEIYYRIGASERARVHLETLIRDEPSHERAGMLLEALGASGGSPDDEDVLSLLGDVEERMSFAPMPWETAPDGESEGEFAADPDHELTRVADETGAAMACLIGKDDAVWSTGPATRLEEVGPRLRDVFQRAARGMELGSPSSLIIEGERGAMVMEMKGAAAMSLVVGERSDAADAAIGARDAVERLVRNS